MRRKLWPRTRLQSQLLQLMVDQALMIFLVEVQGCPGTYTPPRSLMRRLLIVDSRICMEPVRPLIVSLQARHDLRKYATGIPGFDSVIWPFVWPHHVCSLLLLGLNERRKSLDFKLTENKMQTKLHGVSMRKYCSIAAPHLSGLGYLLMTRESPTENSLRIPEEFSFRVQKRLKSGPEDLKNCTSIRYQQPHFS
ncbi:hypothetical protein BDZ97DRAFT_810675 [Flammula alnicola]|nr:hypothetical protein BDZ97DRAFT_810675 [Flammula alnicola]